MAERAGKEDEFESFSYVIEDINHANDMEPLRKQMVEKYAGREDRDTEALLKKPRIRETRGGSHGGKKVKGGHGRGRDPQGEGDRGHVPRDEGGQGQHRHRDFPDGGGQGQRDPNDNEEIPELPGLSNWVIHATYLRVSSDEDDDDDDFTVDWPEAYRNFIKLFREAVAPDTYGGGNIRIMSDKAKDELHKWDYQLFDRLGFTSEYGDLQKYSGSSMLTIGLGMQKLSDLVINLQRFERGRAASKDNDIATGLLISVVAMSLSLLAARPLSNLLARSVDFMVSKILEKPPGFKEFVATAKLRMKAFLKFVEEEVWISNEDEKSLLHEVWLDPCFFGSLAAAIDYNNDIVHLILSHLKEDAVDVAARVDRMKADPNFVNSVRGLKKRTSRRTFLRLFLSILFSFWGDEVLLRELEQKMGKRVFGWRLDMMAKGKARMAERAGKKDEFEYFSYVIEDISHANDMEPLRKQMVEKYAGREDRDIEALLKQVNGTLVGDTWASFPFLVHFTNNRFALWV
ncbi:hypothetical protein CASFOL_041098 [Castilleja foliolosa]|uniref:Uncharacterized protein n=1 Tax=Castilleja foliolosa TaxID=1961234 RepID=A0ABD3BF53_9LAMI